MDDRRLQRFVQQHDLIYHEAPRYWEDGFPVGNGHFGGMVWQPLGIEIGLCKLDVWDRRTGLPDKVPFDRLKELFRSDPQRANEELAAEAERSVDYPYPKPLGRIRVDIEHDFLPLYQSVFAQTQRLRLYEATVTCRYESNYKATRLDCYVASDQNLLVAEVQDEWLHPGLDSNRMKQRVSLFREYDEVLGMPETGAQDGTLWVRYPFPDGFEYVLALAVGDIAHSEPVLFTNEACVEVELDYRDRQPKTWTIHAAAATSMDGDDPKSRALGIVAQAKHSGPEPVRETQRRWWQGFWAKSGIELSDRFAESLWYLSLYQLASTSRGKTAPGLCGLWNMQKSPPWHGDYHGDINMVMTYWGVFGSNHLEIGEPYFETFSRLLPIVKAQTRELYGIDGAKYPIATLDTGVELTGNYYRIMQCTGGFYALVFWWRWLYEQDEAVLREQIFPVLEECSKFYLGIAENRDGTLYFGPSWAPEQGPFPCTNSTNDLGLIKPLWQAYVQACEILAVDTPWLGQIKDGLGKFPPYPVKDGLFLDSYTAGEPIGLNHPGLLAMVVPGNEVDADHELAQTAARTMEAVFDLTIRKGFEGRRAFCCDLTWPWLVAVAARLGLGDVADRYLFDVGVSEHLKPNGMFALNCCASFQTLADKRRAFQFSAGPRHGAIFWCPTSQRGRELYFQFIQAPGGVLYAMTEMLLQSHGDIIRVFPAVPGRMGDCAFRDLLAQGGFEVSARMKDGRVQYVSVRSLKGNDCRLRLPERRTWWLSTGEPESVATTGRELSFATEPGKTYVIAPGPRRGEVDTSLKPGVKPGVKRYWDKYDQEIWLGKLGDNTWRGEQGLEGEEE